MLACTTLNHKPENHLEKANFFLLWLPEKITYRACSDANEKHSLWQCGHNCKDFRSKLSFKRILRFHCSMKWFTELLVWKLISGNYSGLVGAMKTEEEKTLSTDWKTFALKASSFKKRNIRIQIYFYPTKLRSHREQVLTPHSFGMLTLDFFYV